MYPHRFLGAVGHHSGGFGVERLDVSSTGEIVASISHDQRVKFWNIQYLEVIDNPFKILFEIDCITPPLTNALLKMIR